MSRYTGGSRTAPTLCAHAFGGFRIILFLCFTKRAPLPCRPCPPSVSSVPPFRVSRGLFFVIFDSEGEITRSDSTLDTDEERAGASDGAGFKGAFFVGAAREIT